MNKFDYRVKQVMKPGPIILRKYLEQACCLKAHIPDFVVYLRQVDPRIALGKALYGCDVVEFWMNLNAIEAAKGNKKLKDISDRIAEASEAIYDCDRQSDPEEYKRRIEVLAKICEDLVYPMESEEILLLAYYLKDVPESNRKDYAIMKENSELHKKYSVTPYLKLRN